MGLTNAQYDEIVREYNRRQSQERHNREKRRQEVYQAIPEMEELERKIVEVSARRTREALLGTGASKGALEVKALRDRRDFLLSQSDFPKDYMDLHYVCRDCKDTGYIGNEKCHCFKQAVLDLLYIQSNIRNVLEQDNFNNFTMKYYDNLQVNKDYGMTSYENMESVVRICREMIADFPREHGNLLLMGDVGMGKTFLARCIAKELLDQYFSVLYLSANEFFDRLSRFHYQDPEEEGGEKYILESDLLIIDDLGTELSNSLTTSKLFYCINERLLRGKGTIITTNLSLDRIRDIYSERISSRILESYRLCYLFGDDVRMKKKRFQ